MSNIKDWFSEYAEKQKSENIIIKDLMSNNAYVNWLDKFTKNKNGICDDAWFYFTNNISEDDQINLEKLSSFYKGINTYAHLNHIYPLPCDFGHYYKVRSGDFGFNLTEIKGQGKFIYHCMRVNVSKPEDFIDFNDVVLNKKQDNVDSINKTLCGLKEMINNAVESGVPIEALSETFNDTINIIDIENNMKLVRKQNNNYR